MWKTKPEKNAKSKIQKKNAEIQNVERQNAEEKKRRQLFFFFFKENFPPKR